MYICISVCGLICRTHLMSEPCSLEVVSQLDSVQVHSHASISNEIALYNLWSALDRMCRKSGTELIVTILKNLVGFGWNWNGLILIFLTEIGPFRL